VAWKGEPAPFDGKVALATSRFLAATAAILLSLLSFAIAADPPAKIASNDNTKNPLVVCAVPDAMPHTARAEDDSPQGVDLAVVQLVAAELGRPLEIHWCASAACSWKCVQEKRCDVVAGHPHGSGPAREVAWSIPYSGSRFGLVIHRDTTGIRSQADLEGKRVGLVAGSVALAAQGHTPVEFKSREQLLDDFVSAKLDAAFVDDDFAAWYLRERPQLPLARVAEYVPRERWNMGLAVRAGDAALLKDLNRALTSVVLNGLVSKAFSERGVSYRAPYTNAEGKAPAGESWKRIRERGEIVASMDPANLPYSAATGDHPGFDVELARALAKELGAKLRIDWIDIHRKTAIGQLLDGECDLAFGAAIEPRAVDDEEEIADKVIYSRPYYGTGYFLVTRQGGPAAKSLIELRGEKSRRLGAEAGSVADYQLRQRGYLRRLFRTQLSVLKSLHDGGIDYAYLWGNVGWALHTSPEFELELVPGYVPEDHWNIAVAMRKGDDELKRFVDAAIQRLRDAEVVSRAVSSYHVPYFAPFEDAKRASFGNTTTVDVAVQDGGKADSTAPAAIRAPTVHAPTNRGIEPQMQRRERSKKRYSALERIRSAGTLVVGLDQNSLPFSAAHPQPAGLDYEIARLLAAKLGVSLSVYWAYSSHDSYPSKLATKELCDLMLGVMPDDRFGTRVAFSKPYYYFDYRFVTAAGAQLAAGGPLAIERGLALRGIRERQVHEHPSLESILEGVVEGKEQTGYVSSARGQWLAANRWPGKLTFVRNDDINDNGPVDRFPICAAIRKADGDLKTAVDQAFEELANSGRLAEIFARWHVPYEAPEKLTEPTRGTSAK
jgi:polar amino acid transport system substrate-binding protein